eukprot:721427-Prymnesium_polylepis.1
MWRVLCRPTTLTPPLNPTPPLRVRARAPQTALAHLIEDAKESTDKGLAKRAGRIQLAKRPILDAEMESAEPPRVTRQRSASASPARRSPGRRAQE